MNLLISALNDPTRRAILEALRAGPRPAGDIAEQFQLGKSTISHHLELLRRAELVTSRKQGLYVIYTLNTTVLDELLGWLLQFKP